MSPVNGTSSRRRSRSRHLAVVSILVAVLALVAACSSSSKGGSSGSATTSGSGGSAASGDAGLAAAKAIVAKYLPRPKSIDGISPIGKTVPKDKSVIFISCGTPNCAEEGDIIKEGTDALGWSFKTINNDGSAEQQKAAFDQAVREKTDIVLYTAIEGSIFASDVADLKKNGTFLSACCVLQAPSDSNGIGYAIDQPDQSKPIGDAQAAYVAADANGKGGDSVFVNIPAIEILKSGQDAYVAGMKKYCPTCSVDTLGIPITSLGKDVPTRVVSYLRSHPKVKYVVAATDSLNVGLPAALKAAGLTDIKIGGQGADAVNLQYIRSGDQLFSVAFPYYEILLSMLNAGVQNKAGVSVTASVPPPVWILDKSTAPDEQKIFPVVPDILDQFKKAWGV